MTDYFEESDSNSLDSNTESVEGNDIQFDEKDQKVVDEILDLLNEIVRPQLAMDGQDIQLKAYKDGIAYFMIKGASSSIVDTTTLYQGIRELLIEHVPDVIDIEQI